MSTQIKDELDSVYRDSTPSFTTVKFWATEFKRCRKSLEDDELSRRPSTATTDENIAKFHQMVLDDCRIKVREISEVMNMSKVRVCHILNQYLGTGVAFAHVRAKTCSPDHFQQSVGAV
ncbi:histone-lysine N-methyltransferase SETMAR [Trichonephila clavipes]|nr:histone-lysine N-methyltransferase SETMAR [Trichonephila clavipes]